jgi:hypothetical protein
MFHFSIFSWLQVKSSVKKIILAGFFFSVLLAALVSCDQAGTDDTNKEGILPVSIIGEWVSDYGETYKIVVNASEENFFQYITDYAPLCYTGTIRFVSNYSNSSGVIIIEYTEKGKPSYDNYNGNLFFAVYYQNLKSASVQLANTWDFKNNCSPDTAGLSEAIEKFTKGNMGKYVDWSFVSPQIKAAP